MLLVVIFIYLFLSTGLFYSGLLLQFSKNNNNNALAILHECIDLDMPFLHHAKVISSSASAHCGILHCHWHQWSFAMGSSTQKIQWLVIVIVQQQCNIQWFNPEYISISGKLNCLWLAVSYRASYQAKLMIINVTFIFTSALHHSLLLCIIVSLYMSVVLIRYVMYACYYFFWRLFVSIFNKVKKKF